MALSAVWALLLHRYSAQDELVLGLLDLRGDGTPAGNPGPTKAAPARTVRSVLAADATWAGLLAGWAAAGGTAEPPPPLRFAAVLTDHLASPEAATQYLRFCADLDAVLLVTLDGSRARVELNGDARVLSRGGLARLRRNFVTLLHGALVQPRCSVHALPLVSRQEQRQLARWNNTAVAIPAAAGGAGLHHHIEQQVDRTPDATAVVLDGQGLRYAELDARANAWAHRLQALGVQRNTIVGVFVERSFDMVVALLAVLKAGGAYLPLEPDFPAQRLHDTLADSGARVVLTQQGLRARLPPAVTALCMDAPASLAGSALRLDRPQAGTQPADACYVIYTSGSTGKPKGAVLPHRAICNHMAWMVAHHSLGADDHVLQKTPFSFDASVWEFFAPLMTGARLVLARPGGHRDMPYLARTIIDHRVTTLQLVPSVLQLLVDEPAFASCTSLRRVFCGGEALTTALVRRFVRRFCRPPSAPHGAAPQPTQLHNLYGPTECCIDTTTFACSADVPAAVQPIGRPIWNTSHHVLDAHLQALPLGVPGELYIGGAGLALAYLNRAPLTAEKFIANPFDTSGLQPRLYRTGDRVRLLPEGNYEFLGRIDFQVKLNGYRIELGEIEAVLEAHPQVRQAVAMLREDRPGHKVLVAYVVSTTSAEPTPADLRQHMARLLPSHMLPGLCVLLPSLPLTSNGKVDRRALPSPQAVQGAEPKPGLNATQHTATQAQLVDIWAEVLDTRHFSLDDDYFALGGDSLGLMRIGLAIRAQLGVDVEPEQLFEHSTLRDQARCVDAALQTRPAAADSGAAPALVTLKLGVALQAHADNGPASLEQELFWSGARALRGWPLFNTSEVIAFTQPLDLQALQRAVNAVVAHHGCLRTLLQPRDGALWQTVAPAGTVEIERMVVASAGLQQLQGLVASLVQRPLNLEHGPATRWVLLSLPDGGHWVVLIVHHALTDGHSTQLIVQDLLSTYQACVAGQRPTRQSPGLSYLHYAAWQRSRLLAGDYCAAQHHWRLALADSPPPLWLPADLPRRAVPRWQGGRETRVLGAELRQALKTLAAAHKASLYMTLLAAFDVLMWELTAQTDLVIGTSLAGRPATALQPLAGCMIGAVPLRVQLNPSLTFEQVLQRVRQTCLNAYRHQDLPLGLALGAATGGDGVPGSKPLLPVWLELHDRQQAWETRFTQLGVQRHDVDRGISESELSLEIDDTGSALVCLAQYKSGLFFARRVQSWLARYQQLLELLVASPTRALSARAAPSSVAADEWQVEPHAR